MSLWEFNAVVSGWTKSQGSADAQETTAPSTDDYYEMLSTLDA